MSPIRNTAWTTAALNALGLLMAVGAMWPGAPDAPRAARLQFLAARPLGWTLGWVTWMLAAVALVVFFSHLARALRRPWGLMALVLVAMGAAVDLLCDAVQVTVVPLAAGLALRDPGAGAPFDLVERAAWAGGVVVGCGLYCLGVGAATLGLARREAAPPLVRLAALSTLAGGAVWVGAEVAGARALLAPATAVTVLGFIAWAVAAPLALERAARESAQPGRT